MVIIAAGLLVAVAIVLWRFVLGNPEEGGTSSRGTPLYRMRLDGFATIYPSSCCPKQPGVYPSTLLYTGTADSGIFGLA